MGIPAFVRKRSRHSAVPLATSETYQTRAALWALRLLVNGKGYRFFIDKDDFKDDDILRLTGLESHSDEEGTLKAGLQLAHLTRAAKVVRQLRLRKTERVEQTMEQLLSSLYQTLGYQWEHKERRPSSSAFNLALSNTDFPLKRLVTGLKRSGQARICLYGPPGIGRK